jgi:hypothetical protein
MFLNIIAPDRRDDPELVNRRGVWAPIGTAIH